MAVDRVVGSQAVRQSHILVAMPKAMHRSEQYVPGQASFAKVETRPRVGHRPEQQIAAKVQPAANSGSVLGAVGLAKEMYLHLAVSNPAAVPKVLLHLFVAHVLVGVATDAL